MIKGTVDMTSFLSIGISYRNAPVEVREIFSLSSPQSRRLIQAAKQEELDGVMVVSTCNRTEIFAQHASRQQLIHLLVSHADGTRANFEEFGFTHHGSEAVDHLFEVAIGLNSQILGDVQIIKQVKDSYQRSAEMEAVSSEMHQLMQHIFRAHKRSRNETSLGGGAATTAYAAVKFAAETFSHLGDKQVLLVGTGKIGKVTCKNLISLGVRNLVLSNRTRERAEFVAERYDVRVADISTLPEEIAKADLIIAATGADQPIIGIDEMQPSLQSSGFKMIIDLAVPRNIDPRVGELEFVDLVNMDMLTDVTREAQHQREEEVPKVEHIIQQERTDYEQWLNRQAVVPTIKALTSKFDRIREDEYDFFKHKIADTDREKVEHLTERIVNKIAAYSIEHLRDNHESRQVSQMVNDMFNLENSHIDE